MENIISQLSSQLNINSNEPNKLVALACIESPALLEEIASYLYDKDKKLVGDCTEVFTEIALTKPEIIVKYGTKLIPLIKHKETRIRWEAMHSLSLIAAIAPEIILSILPELDEIIHNDKSIIVRDYAADAIAKYAGAGKEAAEKAFPLLNEILGFWGERHAARAIEGLINIYKIAPYMKQELLILTEPFKESTKGVVSKAALKLEKLMSK